MTSLLIVEDDARLRASMTLQLEDEGFAVSARSSAEDALQLLESEKPIDLMLVDVRLSGSSGIDLVAETKKRALLPPTIVVSGEATMSETVTALRLGVVDFIEKPFTRERLLRSIELALEVTTLRRRVDQLSESGTRPLIGESPAMQELKKLIELAGRSSSRVLITGESGTGKELIADQLHQLSDRSQEPFIRLNCGAIAPNLIEDELFGHARGAFTDAKTARPGLFEVADGGTLFLDEIGDLDPGLQSRLLRVLEDGRIRRLGETKERLVDVRVIAATHQTLLGSDSFREDLFYRLSELRLEVPPLRNRGDDLDRLFDHLLREACRRQRTRERSVEPDLRTALRHHRWPGNVRELKNVCNHLSVFGGETLTVKDLPASVRFQSPEGAAASEGLLHLAALPRRLTLKQLRRRCEREFLEFTLRRFGWNFTRTAKHLGIKRTHLHQRCKLLGISRPP